MIAVLAFAIQPRELLLPSRHNKHRGAPCTFPRRHRARVSAKRRTRATIAPRSSRRCSIGQITKRDLFKWGIYTTTGALALKNGLSPFARSAYADDIPTGTPRSPLGTATKFSQPMPRLALQTPYPLTKNPTTGNAVWPAALGERDSKRLSWHTDFTANPSNPAFRNPLNNRGPIEGRPPGEVFAHQRWDEFFPKVGYVMSWGQIQAGTKFHPGMTAQNPNAIWTYGPGRFVQGRLPPFLIKGRYGEPILTRIYNNTPLDRTQNGGFGRNESQLHHHNAHNGAESDGAANVHHFPGTFYDYRWSTTLARRDKINTGATDNRASGPNGNGGLVRVAGDFRELQGTLWAHDHRFFFTAENVYKGNVGMVNYYSGPDRGNEGAGRRRQPAPAERQAARLRQRRLRREPRHLGRGDEPERATVLRHVHDRRLPWRSSARELRLRAVHERAAAQVPLPHPERLHVAVLSVLHLEPEQSESAVQVHRQRRQLRRQPDHAHHARSSGQRGALRYRGRLLVVPDRLAAQARQPARDARRRPRPGRHAVARRGAAGRRRRSGDRADARIPCRRFGAERRRPRRHALLDDAGHQPGAEHAHRSRFRSSRRCARASSSSAAPATATRAGRTASARRTARRTCRSRGPSRSTGRKRIR